MKVTNYTKFDTELIKEIIRFVRPPGISNFDIKIKNSEDGWKGKAYCGGVSFRFYDRESGESREGYRTKPLVVIGVPHKTTERTRYKRPRVTDYQVRGYLRSVQFSPVEDMVHLLAHELRHLWQAKVPRGRRVWGARGKFSERDADAYAIRKTREWRRKGASPSLPLLNRVPAVASPDVSDAQDSALRAGL